MAKPNQSLTAPLQVLSFVLRMSVRGVFGWSQTDIRVRASSDRQLKYISSTLGKNHKL